MGAWTATKPNTSSLLAMWGCGLMGFRSPNSCARLMRADSDLMKKFAEDRLKGHLPAHVSIQSYLITPTRNDLWRQHFTFRLAHFSADFTSWCAGHISSSMWELSHSGFSMATIHHSQLEKVISAFHFDNILVAEKLVLHSDSTFSLRILQPLCDLTASD